MKTKLQQIYARRSIDFVRSRRYTRVPWLSFRRGGGYIITRSHSGGLQGAYRQDSHSLVTPVGSADL